MCEVYQTACVSLRIASPVLGGGGLQFFVIFFSNLKLFPDTNKEVDMDILNGAF